jgi:hypothetical protein
VSPATVMGPGAAGPVLAFHKKTVLVEESPWQRPAARIGREYGPAGTAGPRLRNPSHLAPRGRMPPRQRALPRYQVARRCCPGRRSRAPGPLPSGCPGGIRARIPASRPNGSRDHRRSQGGPGSRATMRPGSARPTPRTSSKPAGRRWWKLYSTPWTGSRGGQPGPGSPG